MYLLIFVIGAFALGFLLARSSFRKSIDAALQKPKDWWQRLFQRSESAETTVEQSNQEQGKEE